MDSKVLALGVSKIRMSNECWPVAVTGYLPQGSKREPRHGTPSSKVETLYITIHHSCAEEPTHLNHNVQADNQDDGQ